MSKANGLLSGATNAEAQVVVPVGLVGGAPVANSRAASEAVPAATAPNAAIAQRAAAGRRVSHVASRNTSIPVIAPLPNISAHIVNS